MRIQALGHACFALYCADGTTIVMDPFESGIGYPVAHMHADIVCTSHGHYDHNYVAAITGDPLVADQARVYRKGNVKISGTACYHDDQQGALRGNNIAFTIESDGLRLVHMGDIGHMPDAQQSARLAQPDVLFIPVGGVFTVDAAGAKQIVDMLMPRIVVPMHYQTQCLTLGKRIGTLDAFTNLFARVQRLDTDTLQVLPHDGQSGVFIPNIG